MESRVRHLILFTLVVGLGAAPAVASPRVYLVSSTARLLELKLDPLEVAALWSLDRVKGVGERFPPRSVEGTYLAGVAFAPDLGDVYLVVPADAPPEVGQPTAFRILRVRLPRWDAVQAEYQLPVALEEPPAIALRADHDELYVEYQDPGATAAAGDRFVREVRVLDRFALHELRTLHSEMPLDSLQLPAGQSYPFFSPATHFLPGTDVAYDHGTLIHFADERYSGEPFDFRAALSPEQASRMAGRFGADPRTGSPRVGFASVDAVGRWALARAVGVQPEPAGEVLAVADVVKGEVVGLLEVPASAANLLPDGRVLVRELLSPPEGRQVSRSLLRTSGKVEIFDPTTGGRVGGFADELLSGKLDDVDYLCATPSSDVLFFRTVRQLRSQLVLADVERGEVHLAGADFAPDRATRCLFVDESP